MYNAYKVFLKYKSIMMAWETMKWKSKRWVWHGQPILTRSAKKVREKPPTSNNQPVGNTNGQLTILAPQSPINYSQLSRKTLFLFFSFFSHFLFEAFQTRHMYFPIISTYISPYLCQPFPFISTIAWLPSIPTLSFLNIKIILSAIIAWFSLSFKPINFRPILMHYSK